LLVDFGVLRLRLRMELVQVELQGRIHGGGGGRKGGEKKLGKNGRVVRRL
jgi:hypothetical protein